MFVYAGGGGGLFGNPTAANHCLALQHPADPEAAQTLRLHPTVSVNDTLLIRQSSHPAAPTEEPEGEAHRQDTGRGRGCHAGGGHHGRGQVQ